jgi:hypothetical protein
MTTTFARITKVLASNKISFDSLDPELQAFLVGVARSTASQNQSFRASRKGCKHPNYKGKRVQLNIRIDEKLKERLDKAKGETCYSDYLSMIIENYLDSNS